MNIFRPLIPALLLCACSLSDDRLGERAESVYDAAHGVYVTDFWLSSEKPVSGFGKICNGRLRDPYACLSEQIKEAAKEWRGYCRIAGGVKKRRYLFFQTEYSATLRCGEFWLQNS